MQRPPTTKSKSSLKPFIASNRQDKTSKTIRRAKGKAKTIQAPGIIHGSNVLSPRMMANLQIKEKLTKTKHNVSDAMLVISPTARQISKSSQRVTAASALENALT